MDNQLTIDTLIEQARALSEKIDAGSVELGDTLRKAADKLGRKLDTLSNLAEGLHSGNTDTQKAALAKATEIFKLRPGKDTLGNAQAAVGIFLEEELKKAATSDALHALNQLNAGAKATQEAEKSAARAARSIGGAIKYIDEHHRQFMSKRSPLAQFCIANAEIAVGTVAVLKGINWLLLSLKGKRNELEEKNIDGHNILAIHEHQLSTGERLGKATMATGAIAAGIGSLALGVSTCIPR